MKPSFLSQWTRQDVPAAQGPAKQHEFLIYVPEVVKILEALPGVANIVDFQADEGTVSVAFCSTSGRHATFILPSVEEDPNGTYRMMAEDITKRMQAEGKITLVADARDVPSASADAILFNNILGCKGSIDNIEPVFELASRVVKPDGYALVTTPNPYGREFSSYRCFDLPDYPKHGASYHFQMRGEIDRFENTYLTELGLRQAFKRHGFASVRTNKIPDLEWNGFASLNPAFFQYLYHKPV